VHSPDIPYAHLSKRQRNDLFQAVELSGVPVTEFELSEEAAHLRVSLGGFRSSRPVTVIRHRTSGAAFYIRPLPREYAGPGDFSRGRVFQVEEQAEAAGTDLLKKWHAPSSSLCDWPTVADRAREWATKVKYAKEQEKERIGAAEEYERTPDLWEELRQDREFFAGQPEEVFENTPFTPGEQAAISSQIKQIRDYITTAHDLTAEQISQVTARLDHAEEASRRMGRKDWFALFSGAVFSLVLTDLVTPDTAQHIVLIAIHGLGHLFGIGGPPPHLPSGA